MYANNTGSLTNQIPCNNQYSYIDGRVSVAGLDTTGRGYYSILVRVDIKCKASWCIYNAASGEQNYISTPRSLSAGQVLYSEAGNVYSKATLIIY